MPFLAALYGLETFFSRGLGKDSGSHLKTQPWCTGGAANAVSQKWEMEAGPGFRRCLAQPSLPGLRFGWTKPLNVKGPNEPFIALGNQEADTPRPDFDVGQSPGHQA
jgi:hypothetical protein